MSLTRTLWAVGFTLVVVALAGPAGAATDTYWQADPAAPANWFDAGNWTAGLPTSSFNAYIDNGGTASIASGTATAQILVAGVAATGNLLQTGGTTNARYLYVGWETGSTGVLELKGGNLNVTSTGWHFIGLGGIGTVNQSGGTLVGSTARMALGYDATAFGYYNLSGSGSLSVLNLQVGTNGSGQFTQTGGSMTTDLLTIGLTTSGQGVVQLNGGTFTVSGDELIGDEGIGQFNQVGGTHNTGYLTVSPSSSYAMTGGMLRVNDGGQLLGTMDFANSAGRVYQIGGIWDLSGGQMINTSGLMFSGSSNSLLILPAGFDPTTQFGRFIQAGLTHVQGETLTVPADKSITGRGTIVGQVESWGSITADTSKHINITGGLKVNGSSTVTLGDNAYLRIDDETSAMGTGGQVSAGHTIIGSTGTARFVQSGGTFSAGSDMGLGEQIGSNGTYELLGGTLGGGGTLEIGLGGTGAFKQDGGALADLYWVILGRNAGSQGTYELVTGTFDKRITIGDYGTGRFVQRTGTATVPKMRLGSQLAAEGTYELIDGTLTVGSESIGGAGTGKIIQTGGAHTVASQMNLGTDYRSTGLGIFELHGGTFSGSVTVGYAGTGRVLQTGGTFDGLVTLGSGAYSSGSYDMQGGELSSSLIGVGSASYEVTAQFSQSGGRVDATRINIGGRHDLAFGVYTLSGGTLNVEILNVGGKYGPGILEITSPVPQFTVSDWLEITGNGSLSAVPGAVIHMTGSSFENHSRIPGHLTGLSNLTLIFEGGAEDVDPFEVAGRDFGADLIGYVDNFALDTLQLGGVDVGQVMLADAFDNQQGWSGGEALYVEDLIVGPGSYLDLAGHPLYFIRAQIDPTATIVGGEPVYVPEPATLALLAAGAGGLALGARRRCPIRRRGRASSRPGAQRAKVSRAVALQRQQASKLNPA